VLVQVVADETDNLFPIECDAITRVVVGVGVLVGVSVWVGVLVGVPVGVLVWVGVLVGVLSGVFVGVGVKDDVGVGVIGITYPSSQLWVSTILMTIFSSSYGGGTSNVYGNTDTVET